MFRERPKPRAPLAIHIGYHKTATTFLQESVFGRPESPFTCPWGVQSANAIEHFVLANPFVFNAAAARQEFFSASTAQEQRHKTLVISHEGLSGDPTHGRYYSREVADRLLASFPEATIVIGIREQRSMILSLYCQHVRRGGCERLEEFVGDGSSRPGFAPTFRLDYLAYDRLVSHYQRLFGPDHVIVMPIETLARDQSQYITRLYTGLGIDLPKWQLMPPQNERLSGMTLRLQRRFNCIAARRDSPYVVGAHRLCRAIERCVPKSLHRGIERNWKQFIGSRAAGMYAESNRQLAGMTGLDLKGFGYEC
jgi:hypothetical protein